MRFSDKIRGLVDERTQEFLRALLEEEEVTLFASSFIISKCDGNHTWVQSLPSDSETFSSYDEKVRWVLSRHPDMHNYEISTCQAEGLDMDYYSLIGVRDIGNVVPFPVLEQITGLEGPALLAELAGQWKVRVSDTFTRRCRIGKHSHLWEDGEPPSSCQWCQGEDSFQEPSPYGGEAIESGGVRFCLIPR